MYYNTYNFLDFLDFLKYVSRVKGIFDIASNINNSQKVLQTLAIGVGIDMGINYIQQQIRMNGYYRYMY